MGIFKPSPNKKAKEISKTNKGKAYEVPAIRGQRGAMSVTPKLAVSTVKTKGTPTKIVAASSKTSDMPRVNVTPKVGQERKTINTYVGGRLAMKEKQGRNLLGQPVVKTKTYGVDGLKKGKEKITLTNSGVKRKSNY